MNTSRFLVGAAVAAILALPAARPVAAQTGYSPASDGTRELTLRSGLRIKLLLEAANLGSDGIEVAEITFPAGEPGAAPAPGHVHGSIEIFYVVEGVLDHVVNGESHRLEAGMLGVVKPGDTVAHRVLSDGPVKAVVMWVPGGEADRIAPPDLWRPVRGGR